MPTGRLKHPMDIVRSSKSGLRSDVKMSPEILSIKQQNDQQRRRSIFTGELLNNVDIHKEDDSEKHADDYGNTPGPSMDQTTAHNVGETQDEGAKGQKPPKKKKIDFTKEDIEYLQRFYEEGKSQKAREF